jgi:hypothetical protein
MTPPRRRRLQIDDPLGPTQSAQRDQPPPEATVPMPEAIQNGRAEATDRLSDPGRRGKREGTSRPSTVPQQQTSTPDQTDQPDNEVWRAWSGITGVGSFRMPHELLAELSDTARELGLPIGMIVTAAITQLLDQPPDEIATLVDKADDARIQARRTARRRLTGRAGG